MNKEEKKEMIRNYLNKKGFTTQPSGSSDDGEVAQLKKKLDDLNLPEET